VYANLETTRSSLTLHAAMKKRDPFPLSSTHFEFQIDNESQLSFIESEKNALVDFLRKELKNYDFHLDIRIIEEEQITVHPQEKLLSGKDKFDYLARKFPELHTLKQTFGLDIEY